MNDEPPALRLFPELVGAIFQLCLPSFDSEDSQLHSAVLAVSQVCSPWREIACSTSELWATLLVTAPGKKKKQKHLLWLPIWLERSGVSPLTIRLNVNLAPASLAGILRLLVPELGRWRSFHLLCSVASPSNLSLPLPIDTPHQLWRMTLEVLPLPHSESIWTFIRNITKSAPSFEHLNSWHVIEDIPWTQLKSIQLPHRANLDIISSQRIIAKSPCLEMGYFHLTRCVTGSVVQQIEHRALRNLRIVSYYPFGSFFDCFCLPSLRELSITNREDALWPHTHILTMLSRSSCLLTRLILRFSDINDLQLIDLLKHPSVCHSLKHLSLYECGMTYMICEYLTIRPESDTTFVIPNLESLSLRTYSDDPYALCRMLESRIGLCEGKPMELPSEWTPSLKTVKLDTSCLLRPPSETQIKLLQDHGLDISVISDRSVWL